MTLQNALCVLLENKAGHTLQHEEDLHCDKKRNTNNSKRSNNEHWESADARLNDAFIPVCHFSPHIFSVERVNIACILWSKTDRLLLLMQGIIAIEGIMF